MSIELMGSYLLYLLIALFRRDTIYYLALPLVIATSLLFFKPFIACFIFGYLIFEFNLRYSSKNSVLISRLGVLSFLSVVITVSFVQDLDSWIKCLLASVLILSACYSSMLKKAFTNPVLLFLGKISFILYLIQFSVICSLSAYIAIQFRDHNFVNLTSTNLNLLATLAVTILCASLLNPLDRYSILISKRIGVQSNRLVGRFRSK
jgi:hypothetical protein